MSSLPTETPGIITLRDVQRRLRQLECERRGCACHMAARQREGLTHCPLHALDPEPTLTVTTDPEGTLRAECSKDCDQMRLWRRLFGHIIIAWEKARWEGELTERRPQAPPDHQGVAIP